MNIKTIIHILADVSLLKGKIRLYSLPTAMHTDKDTFETLLPFDGKIISLDISKIYFNYWVNDVHGLIIPDCAKLLGTKRGFYLEQSEEMINLRDNTLQCSYCQNQFKGLITWCPDCLGNSDIDEADLYKLYLRPVSTLDIELNHRSIFVPKAIKEKHTRLPQLTSNGHMLNI